MYTIGLKREKNQDSILCNSSLGLYVVADGMGGHQGGEIASAMAVELIEEQIRSIMNSKINNIKMLLKSLVSNVSHKINKKAKMNVNLSNMGTTLVMLFFFKDKCYLVQVGDSRVYLYKKKNMWQITEDHSLVNEQFNTGLITREQAKNATYKNVITRSLGLTSIVKADVYERQIEDGDIFLLA